MADIQQPSRFLTRPSSILKLPRTKTINQISNIEPHIMQQPIDIENDEREVIEVFIHRMNQFDQENNEQYTFIQDVSHQQRFFGYDDQFGTPEIKERMLNECDSKNSSGLNQSISEENKQRILISQKGKEIEFQLSALQIQKFQIIDTLITFKQQILTFVKSQIKEWSLQLEIYEQDKTNIRQEYEQKLNKFQQGLRNQKNKYELQILQKYEERQDNNNHLTLHIQELEDINSKLHRQLELFQAQSSDLKDQLNQNADAEALRKQLQEELNLANRTIDQNSEYIFDLEQRLATQSLHLAEIEADIRKQMELRLQQEREEIQAQYKTEFQKIRQQMEEQISSQLRNDYQDLYELKSQHQNQISYLQASFEEQNCKIKAQNQNIQQTIKEYQIKLKQLGQKSSSSDNTQHKFIKKVENFQLRLREKDVELNYYKQRVQQLELFKVHPNKQNNILLIDQLNNSNSFAKQTAVSPCSTGITHLQAKQVGSPRDDMINNILSRIRMRQNYSILSNFNQSNLSMESTQFKKGYNNSVIKPVSPQSMILEKQKDLRMKNISYKLQQLRSDIRREIGLISN